MTINSQGKHFQTLGEEIRSAQDKKIHHQKAVWAQRYIASGLSGKDITIEGTPGNALGAYLDGSTITVRGNVQDATGDTMNDGAIYVDGQAGDATGYAMAGGKYFIHGDVGYRAGISHEGIIQSTKLPCVWWWRPGRQLSGRIPGWRYYCDPGSPLRRPGACGILLRHRHAWRQDFFSVVKPCPPICQPRFRRLRQLSTI